METCKYTDCNLQAAGESPAFIMTEKQLGRIEIDNEIEPHMYHADVKELLKEIRKLQAEIEIQAKIINQFHNYDELVYENNKMKNYIKNMGITHGTIK